ncbi:hypothetical protein LJC13_02370 [Peptostreptococcaceae bacterium OttesenSCG-928-C18]|nr:hypothetical protein [Peptostreptococcaceae bacterium OttesenSCG-928-C18]
MIDVPFKNKNYGALLLEFTKQEMLKEYSTIGALNFATKLLRKAVKSQVKRPWKCEKAQYYWAVAILLYGYGGDGGS